MNKIVSFLVDKRYLIMVVMLVIAVFSVFWMQDVNIISDMAEYLPNDSGMRVGLDLMEEEFPDMETDNTIRVMYENMPESVAIKHKAAFESIEYVDNVEYELGDKDFNKDIYTLFKVNFTYDYHSEEAIAIENTIAEDFADYNMIYSVDSNDSIMPNSLLVIAVVLALIILFIMCESWLEPILFLITIMLAVLINMGTNAFLPNVSNVTYSIAAILQMALSMDYSIILINRYRQELALDSNKNEAMKKAIRNSFSSVASSAVTTIVGLLVLVFMRFRIGMDMGIVLAKGVTLSLVCVFTVLPTLILLCTKGIQKTAKRTIHFRLGGLASIGYKLRRPLTIAFVVIFVALFAAKGNVAISYTVEVPNAINDVFPPYNTIVMLYNNEDERMMRDITDTIEEDAQVDTAISFYSMLDRDYTASDIVTELSDLAGDSDFDLDDQMMNMIYYYYYENGETGDITVTEFLNFILNDVMDNDSFAEYIDDDFNENKKMLEEFSSSDNVLRQRTSADLADVLDMDSGDIDALYMLYYATYGGVEYGTMSLKTFVDFILNDVALDPDYSDFFDDDVLDEIKTLRIFTDKKEVVNPKNAAAIADALDMDAETIDLLFMYYYANKGAADDKALTFPEFVELIQNKVLDNENFSDFIEDDMREDIDRLSMFSDSEELQSRYPSEKQADTLDMEQDTAELLYMYYYANHNATDGHTLTLAQFVDVLENGILEDDRFDDMLDDDITENIDTLKTFSDRNKVQTPYSSSELADMLGMEEDMASLLYLYYYAENDKNIADRTMTASHLVDILTAMPEDERFEDFFDDDTAEAIDTLKTITNEDTILSSYSYKELADLLGFDEDMAQLLYLYYDAQQNNTSLDKMTFAEFVQALKDISEDEDFASMLEEGMTDKIELLEVFTQPITMQTPLSPQGMAKLLSGAGLDENTVSTVYSMYAAKGSVTGMSLADTLDFLIDDVLGGSSPYEYMLGIGMREQLQSLRQIVTIAGAGPRPGAELAAITGMSRFQALSIINMCTACNGTAMEACGTCTGSGHTICGTCTGTGGITCATCGGTGETAPAVPCGACSGSGTTACTAGCTGGSFICTTCGGGGYLPCSGCFGVGFHNITACTDCLGIGCPTCDNTGMGFTVTTATLQDYLYKILYHAAYNPAFAPYFTAEAMAQLQMMYQLTLIPANMPMNAAQLSQALGVEASMIDMVFTLKGTTQAVVLPTETFAGIYLQTYGHLLDSATYAALGSVAMSPPGAPKSSQDIADEIFTLTGFDINVFRISSICGVIYANGMTMSPSDFIDFLAGDLGAMMGDSDDLATLKMMKNVAASNNKLSYTDMATVMGMEEDMIKLLYLIKMRDNNTWTAPSIALYDAVEFIAEDLLNNKDLAGAFDTSELSQVKTLKEMMDGVLAGEAYNSSKLSDMLDFEESTIKMLFAYDVEQTTGLTDWSMSLNKLVDYVLDEIATNKDFEDVLDDDMLTQLKLGRKMIKGTIAGKAYSDRELADLVEMDVDMLQLLYAYDIMSNGATGSWLLSLEELVDYILEEMKTNDDFSEMLEADAVEDLELAQSIIKGVIAGTSYTPQALGDLVDMDADLLKLLYAYHMQLYDDTSAWRLSLEELVNYILSDVLTDEDFGDMLDAHETDGLEMLRDVIAGTVSGRAYSPSGMANLLDMDRDMPEMLYQLNISKYGDTTDWLISMESFINFIIDEVMTDEDYADMINEDNADMLDMAQQVIAAVKSGQGYSYTGLTELLGDSWGELDENTLKMMYVYYFSRLADNSQWTMSPYRMFNYMVDDILYDPVFSDFIDDDMRLTLQDSQKDMDEGLEQMVGENYSRIIMSTTYPEESAETFEFLSSLTDKLDNELTGDYYIIGNSAMAYEMSQTFADEMNLISILTIIAIFIVVALTFKSMFIPMILILIIQGGISATITIIGLQGYAINYLALVIVQSILMGSTIDYAILFTNYYKEYRLEYSILDSLKKAYDGSIHTILTSGLIIIIVTGALGMFFSDPTIAQICQTLSQGATCAIVLILLLLPALLATFDRFICKQRTENKADDMNKKAAG